MSEWVGECSWCGEEVEIFGHSQCPTVASNDMFDALGPQPV